MGNCFSSTLSNTKKFSRKHFKLVKRWISKNSTNEGDFAIEAEIFPHYLPEILENVMSFLDTDSLKTCRSVSPEWNYEALRILSKRWYISINQQSHIKSLRSYWKDPQSTLKLNRTLEKCSVPRYFFTNITVPLCSILHKKGIQKMIQTFGIHVKTLELDGLLAGIDQLPEYEMLHQVLTCWCPNLTTLSVCIPSGSFQTPKNLLEFTHVNPLSSVRSLELRGIGCKDRDNGSVNPNSEEFAMFLIKSCSNLSSLRMRTCPFQVFHKLSEFPEITRNLEKFTWADFNSSDNNCGCANLKSLALLQFSSKLKHIDLWLNVALSDSQCRQLLYRFLRKFSTHLEYFNFGVNDYFPPTRSMTNGDKKFLKIHRPVIHWSDIEAFVPEMKKLKVLILYGNNVFGLDSFHFLKRCPNLVKFHLGHDKSWSICINNYPKEDFYPESSQFDWVKSAPRVNLKELDIRDRWADEAVFEALPKGVPNLTSLSINNYTSTVREIFIKSVTKLEHLMDLSLNIYKWCSTDVLTMLPMFKDCKALRNLKIINSRCLYRFIPIFEHSTCQEVWDVLSSLKDMQCVFTFKNFPMKKTEENKLLAIVKKNGMHLKWISIPELVE